MSAYFYLELDTTPPEAEIIAPYYTIPTSKLPVEIIANEELDLWHEVYLIDAQRERHNFTFQYLGDRFYGLLDITAASLGIATIYAKVQDKVHNVSSLMTATVDVKTGAKIYVFPSEMVRAVDIAEVVRQIAVSEKARNGVAEMIVSRKITTDKTVRQIDLEVK